MAYQNHLIKRRTIIEPILVIVVIALITAVVRYWHFFDFGLYSDDLTRIPHAFSMSVNDLIKTLGSFYFVDIPHGRPFHASLIYIFAFMGGWVGNISILYIMGWLIFVFNVVLLYFLLRRFTPPSFALLASLLFILFPADTTQIYITQSFGIQPSLTFLLLAFHSFLSGKRVLSYVLAFGSLLTYESTYLLFVVAPLFEDQDTRSMFKEFVKHSAIVVLVLVVVFILRSFEGDQRLFDVGFPAILIQPIKHMLIGPSVNLATYIYRPTEVILTIFPRLLFTVQEFSPIAREILAMARLDGSVAHHPDMGGEIATVFILAFFFTAIILTSASKRISSTRDPEAPEYPLERTIYSSPTETLSQLKRLAVAAAIMLVISYPLIIVIPAYTIRGRNTRVHFAGATGATILIAIIMYIGFMFVQSKRKRIVLALGWSLLVAFLVSSSFIIQLDYVNAWNYQKAFWKELIPLIPDADDGDAILVTPEGLVDSWQISANTWNLPRILPYLLDYPDDWDKVPRVYRLSEGWNDAIHKIDGQYSLDETTTVAPPSYYTTVDPSHLILIDSSSGSLVRVEDEIRVNDAWFIPKISNPSAVLEYPRGVLYLLMTLD